MKKNSTSKSAFLNLRVLLGFIIALADAALALLGSGSFTSLFAQSRNSSRPPAQRPLVRAQYRGVLPVVKFDVSPPLRSMKPKPAKECTKSDDEEEGPIPLGPVGPVVRDPVVQRVMGRIGIPGPLITFDGNSNLCG